MVVKEILSRLGEVGKKITSFRIEESDSWDCREVYNLEELMRLVRHCTGLAKALPHPRIAEAAADLERDVSVFDVPGVYVYYGDALAFVDTVEALGAKPELLEQAYSKQFAGKSDPPTTDMAVLQETISEIEAQVTDMASELKSLRNQLAEMRAGSSQAGDKLNPKERQSLQKMILGMAIEQYGYAPSARGPAVSQIADDLQGHGLSLDQDTIRKQLKAAAEEFLEQSIAA